MRRKDFPIFRKHRHLVYLDTAATAQRPRVVIEAMQRFMALQNAPVHRSLYPFGEAATARFESVRQKTAQFLGSRDPSEIIFVRNATEALNLVAQAWGRANVREGDIILVSRMEHHSNFVPWQVLAKEKGAQFRIAELTPDGHLDLADLRRKLTSRVKIVALSYVSNVLGTINPLAQIASLLRSQTRYAEGRMPLFVVDAAQAAPHIPINVQKLGCDFLAFSGHKLYGPTGVGILWGRREILETMPPFLTGGHMILEVGDQHAIWNDVPAKFEAGTPDTAGVVGLGAAIDYLERIGWKKIVRHERTLMAYALRKFRNADIRKAVTIYGPQRASERTGAIAFTVEDVHPHDVATLLAEEGIAVRAGHHCAMPLHGKLGLPATTRISFGLYNEKKDIDRFFRALTERVFSARRLS